MEPKDLLLRSRTLKMYNESKEHHILTGLSGCNVKERINRRNIKIYCQGTIELLKPIVKEQWNNKYARNERIINIKTRQRTLDQ